MMLFLAGFAAMTGYITGPHRPGPKMVQSWKALVPPLWIALALSVIFLLIVQPGGLKANVGDLVASALFGENFYGAVKATSLEEAQPFRHLWAVSFIMQFSLVWLFVTAGRRTRKKINNIAYGALGLSVLSGLLMALYGSLGMNLVRILVLPDSRFFSLGAGIFTGYYYLMMSSRQSTGGHHMATGLMVILLLVVLFAYPPMGVAILGLEVLVSILVSIFAYVMLLKGNALERMGEMRVLTLLGERAYGYYLLSYPVTYGLRLGLQNESVLLQDILALVVLLVLGELVHQLLNREGIPVTKVVLASLAICLLGSGLGYSMEGVQVGNLPTHRAETTKKPEGTEEKDGLEEQEEGEDFRPSQELAASLEQINALYPKYRLQVDELGTLRATSGVVIGGPAMQVVRDHYDRLMPKLNFEMGSYHLGEITSLMANYGKQLEDPVSPIILQVTENGEFDLENLRQALDAAQGQRVLIINGYGSEEWMEKANDKVATVASEYPNVFMVDWYGEILNAPDYFDDEANRPTESGAKLMAQMVARTLLDSAQGGLPPEEAKPRSQAGREEAREETQEQTQGGENENSGAEEAPEAEEEN
ncbi:MAG: acyltransferase family protein [Tissierellia bacterium]|nr:acyltransferase family protein [Tissierellia bacterium]